MCAGVLLSSSVSRVRARAIRGVSGLDCGQQCLHRNPPPLAVSCLLAYRQPRRDRAASLSLGGYCRAMAARISLSLSVMSSPETSTVTLCSVPVNRNGDG